MKKYNMTKSPHQYIVGSSSKGNQWKWKEDGYWYKADQFGFEGIAESLITQVLDKVDVPFPYLKYEPVQISYDNNILGGCRSRDLYEEFPDFKGYEIVPLEKLYQLFTGNSLVRNLAKIPEVEDRMTYTVDFVKGVTGLGGFGDYLSFMIEADAFFLNEDRHLNNIAVLRNPDTDIYEYCPYFDFALSLFSDVKNDYPLDMDIFECLKNVQAKPFSHDFDEQLDEAEKISDKRFRISMNAAEIRKMVEAFLGEYDVDERISRRITDTFAYQTSKYGYMIKG